MPTQKTVTLYQYDELSDRAKEKAREWYTGEGFEFDPEYIFEDFETIAGFLGISIRQQTVKLMGGGTRGKPVVYYTGFWSQGDGACFEGTWYASDVKPGKVKEHAPKNAELHSIAETFERIARENPEAFFRVVHRGHYYHSLCTSFEFEDDMPEEVCENLKQAARDLMDWLYSTLQNEYEYQTGEENVAETIRINEYTFLEDGTRED